MYIFVCLLSTLSQYLPEFLNDLHYKFIDIDLYLITRSYFVSWKNDIKKELNIEFT